MSEKDSRFEITRKDGRSNAQVILNLVRGKEPGTIFSYEEIGAALAVNTNREYSTAAVRGIVAALYSRLLQEQQRALHNVRGRGYRLAPANQHTELAQNRKRRADVQIIRGLDTLRHVRWDEMNENERQAHSGQLLVLSALWENQRALERRQSAVEAALLSIKTQGSEATAQ